MLTVLTVLDALERDGSVRPYPKSGRRREIPLTARCVVAPREHLQRGDRTATGWVFTSTRGTLLGYHNVRRAWRSAVEGLAEPRPTFHDLRHTFGTRLVRAGVPLVDIGQLMGHSDLAVPQRYIAASVPDSQRSWITQALEATSASGSSSSGSGSPSARAAVSASHFK